MKPRTRRCAFTLVELLVVIGIIVVLLALLVPAVTKALKMADKTKCAANQRNMAQVLVGYATENPQKNFPPSVLGQDVQYRNTNVNVNQQTGATSTSQGNVLYRAGSFAYATDYRVTEESRVRVGLDTFEYLAQSEPEFRTPEAFGIFTPALIRAPLPRLPIHSATGNVESPGGGVNGGLPLGLGVLAAVGALPSTKLGEIAHCPSLNTSSAAPSPEFGTDTIYTVNEQAASSGETRQGSGTPAAGGSFWVDPAQGESRIIGSYNYRALSFALERGGSASIKTYDSTSNFVVLADLLDVRYGRQFAHLDGYNVSYGDGSTRYYEDNVTRRAGETRDYGDVERLIPGYNTANPTPIDGRTGLNLESARIPDERLYEHLSVQRKK